MLETVSLKQHNGVPSPCIWAVSYTHLDVYKRQAHECIVRGIHGPLAQGYHAAISALAGAGVDGGENGHAHAGGLLGGISLRASHLAHGDDVGIEAKGEDVYKRQG